MALRWHWGIQGMKKLDSRFTKGSVQALKILSVDNKYIKPAEWAVDLAD
jgi:hypothetical protein